MKPKKKPDAIFFVICILGCVIMRFIVSYIINDITVNTITYKLPSNVCQALFYCDPDEFTENCISLGITNNDRCYSYSVDEKGNLLLSLTEEQIENWKEQCKKDIKSATSYRTKVSSEYDRVVFEDEHWPIGSTGANQAVVACAVLKMLDGCKPEEIFVEFIVVDGISKEELHHVVWPTENWSWR